MGRSRGGLTTKIHALTDARGLPIELVPTPGLAGDCPVAAGLLGHLREGTIGLADKAYDGDWLRRQIEAAGAAPNIPPMVHRRWRPASEIRSPKPGSILSKNSMRPRAGGLKASMARWVRVMEDTEHFPEPMAGTIWVPESGDFGNDHRGYQALSFLPNPSGKRAVGRPLRVPERGLELACKR